jgi:hypothetical protein
MTINMDDLKPEITRDGNSLTVRLSPADVQKMELRCKEDAAKYRKLKGASANDFSDEDAAERFQEFEKLDKSTKLAALIGGININDVSTSTKIR